MKHIKLFFAVAILCAATFVGYNAYTNATMTEQERLIQANLEALSSDAEQPDVNDCKYKADWVCEALHPTDPSLDISRRDSVWE